MHANSDGDLLAGVKFGDEPSSEGGKIPRPLDCQQHGPYLSRIHIRAFGKPYEDKGCPHCEQELAAARREQERAERAAYLAQRREDERIELLGASGLNARFQAATFEAFIATDERHRHARSFCEAYARTVDRTAGGALLLVGPPGTGKTHLASAIVLTLINERGISAELITVSGLVREVRATWRRDAKTTEDAVIERLGRVGLLVLDDLGAGYSSDSEAKILLDVIDARYSRQRPTVVTTNLKPSQIKGAIGDRAADRLRDGLEVLTLNWPSHRRPVDDEEAAS